MSVASIDEHEGLAGPGIVEVHDEVAHLTTPLVRTSFLVRHPSARDVTYATRQQPEGGIAAVTPRGVQEMDSGGGTPCHLTAHPDGRWLYVTNYRDAVVRAIPLEHSGEMNENAIDLSHEGRSVHPERQTSAHAHATSISPDGRWLVVTDLGADVLHAHRLHDGEPEAGAVRTTLPAGSGPRHMVWRGHTLYVTCELSGDIAVIDWDEHTGAGSVRGVVPTSAYHHDPAHLLSDLVIVGETLYTALRGGNRISALAIERDGSLVLAHEVPTLQRPTHLGSADGKLLVAGTDANAIGVHDLDPAPGQVATLAAVAQPMCILLA